MNARNWSLWVALLAASCLAAGCGGEGGADNAAAAAQAAQTANTAPAPAPVQWSMTRITEYGAEPATAVKASDPDFAGKDMAPLLPNASNGYFNSALKLLIASVGPQRLVDHLRHFEQQTEDPGERLAASRFIALIEALHHSDSAVCAAEMMESLQVLPPFDALEPGLKNAALDPIDFLVQLAPLLRLQELPGATVEAAQAATGRPADASALFHAIPAEPVQEDVPLPVQQALDQLGDSIHTADIAQLQHLTILPPADGHHWFQFATSARMTLPVFDEKSRQTMQVTLAPKATLMLDKTTYHVYLQDHGGVWNKHHETTTTPLVSADSEATLQALTLQVVDAVPMQ